MRRRTDRYAMDLTVELYVDGEARRVPLADLSRSGMFLRGPALPIGELVHVAMFFEGRQLATPARVVHGLGEADARVLGRRPGIGIAFERPTRHADAMFLRAVQRMLAGRERPIPDEPLRVVVADASTRLLERLSTELSAAGCAVATATNGLEALGAALRHAPDVIVVDRALPVFDGFQVAAELARRDELRHVPAIVMAHDAAELAGAFDRGAKDVLHKPFTSIELATRCRRLVRSRHELSVIFRADLAELSLAAVLVMLEQERTSGRLEVTGEHPAWIELASGTIVGASMGDGQPADPRTVVMALLDWKRGEARLVAAPPGERRVALPITYALMEHARVADERRARRITA